MLGKERGKSPDSLEPEQVYASEPFDVACHEAPEQCYATGCGWPVCFTLDAIPQGWASGFYIVRCEASAQPGGAVGAATGVPGGPRAALRRRRQAGARGALRRAGAAGGHAPARAGRGVVGRGSR